MEADFRREYGIDLVVELPRMSLRTFLSLLAGLSANAVTPTALRKRKESDPLEIAKQIRAMLK